MTITLNITKADLIALVAHELAEKKRTEDLDAFYARSRLARDVQEVLRCVPDGVHVDIEP